MAWDAGGVGPGWPCCAGRKEFRPAASEKERVSELNASSRFNSFTAVIGCSKKVRKQKSENQKAKKSESPRVNEVTGLFESHRYSVVSERSNEPPFTLKDVTDFGKCKFERSEKTVSHLIFEG
jgi:hypothetical protein